MFSVEWSFCLAKLKHGFILGAEVVVLDAAVLLEAGWDAMVDEVWTTVIPTAEVSHVLHINLFNISTCLSYHLFFLFFYSGYFHSASSS